jgi:hypothetical protein
MKRMLVLLALLVLVVGCESVEITGERLKEVNDQWLKMYTADRRMTAEEATAYAALDEAGKAEWRRAGKPTDRPMSSRGLDATMDVYKGVDAEAEAAKKKNE